MNVEIEGFEELNKVLNELAKKYPEAVLKGCAKTAFKVERKAKELCPVDTGNLRSSIRTTVDKKDGLVMVSAGGSSEGTAEVGYAVYVNYGTRKMEPRPFFTNALEEVRDIADDIKQAIDEETR